MALRPILALSFLVGCAAPLFAQPPADQDLLPPSPILRPPAPPAVVPWDPRWAPCANRQDGYSHEQRLHACTALIESGTLRPSRLSLAYLNRSTVYGERNQLREAIADLDSALAADPRHAMAHNNRGFLRMRRGDEAGALTDFANAIRFGPELALPLANRALLYRKRGDDALAEADEAEAERVRERYGPTYRGRPANPRPDGEVPAIAMPAAPPGR